MINELKELYNICFGDSEQYTDYLFKHKYTAENVLYHKEGGRIVSQLFIVGKKINIRGKVIPCPYIAGVCTHPDYRNKGLAALLLNRCFDLLKEKGHALCALHPFRHSFYEKFGFVTYNRIKIFTPSYSGGCCVLKDITENDIPLLMNMYDNFTAGYSGYTVRDYKETLNRFEEFKSSGECKLIYKGDKKAGYVYYDDKLAEEYCAPFEMLGEIKELDKKQVYVPLNSRFGEINDFTMLKIISREKLSKMFDTDSLLQKLDDKQFIHAVTGSWRDFNISLPGNVKQKYCGLDNFVYDRY